ncbi:MFS transporter [Gemmatimonas phototrophica]|uniref:MFS transporter n=2 Tax=Gemmatimonas phototrophica TaxID=1379270 RepID=A0A143BQQ9_9BACT|nr:MFS transporter [Gemmatimonas phototrophica]
MAAMDAAIIAPAIPALRSAFGVDNRQIGLVTIVFSLCSLTSTALMAALSDRFGRRNIYLMDIAGFALGSLIIAQSNSFGVLLLGRAIQGLSAGGITPTASAVVGDTFPPDQRGKILGLIGATFGMAFLFGPILASAILVVTTWHWIFLVNLPLAAIVFTMGYRALPRIEKRAALPPFDFAGITALAIMLASLTLGINRAVDTFTGVTIWPALLITAALALPLLIACERRAALPIVPLNLFGTKQLRTTWVLCSGAGFGMGSVIFISSVAVAAFNTPPNKAGLLLLPLVLCSSVASALFGRLQNTMGPRAVMLWGFGTLGVGSLLIGLFAAAFWAFIAATLFIGAGVGIVVGGTLRTVVLNEVSAAQRSAAQALVNIGIAIGNLMVVAVLSALADRAGGGLSGLQTAYLAATGVMSVMMIISLRLQPIGERKAA